MILPPGRQEPTHIISDAHVHIERMRQHDTQGGPIPYNLLSGLLDLAAQSPRTQEPVAKTCLDAARYLLGVQKPSHANGTISFPRQFLEELCHFCEPAPLAIEPPVTSLGNSQLYPLPHAS